MNILMAMTVKIIYGQVQGCANEILSCGENKLNHIMIYLFIMVQVPLFGHDHLSTNKN